MKERENGILVSIGVATVCMILCGLYLLWTKPKFLYMPIYENYEKDSEIHFEDDTGTEMAESQCIEKVPVSLGASS